MGFWIRNIAFLAVLLALSYYLFENQDTLFPEQQAETLQEEQSAVSTTGKVTVKPKITKKNSNAAAAGLSRFYANLHGEADGDGPRVRNNIVYLPEPKGDLVEILEARRLVTRPLRANWRGTTENRPFRKGETLHQKLVEYANKDGLEVIWWLNRDFIIKDPFRIDKNIIKTAYQVGNAVGGHFPDGLSIFFCNQQRTLVLIEKDISYLSEECLLLPQKRRNY